MINHACYELGHNGMVFITNQQSGPQTLPLTSFLISPLGQERPSLVDLASPSEIIWIEGFYVYGSV